MCVESQALFHVIMQVLWGECVSGALYTGDFIAICQQVGFADPRQVSISEITIQDPELKSITGNARFFSITFRLFKLPGLLEPACEDYGQVAVYKVSCLMSFCAHRIWARACSTVLGARSVTE